MISETMVAPCAGGFEKFVRTSDVARARNGTLVLKHALKAAAPGVAPEDAVLDVRALRELCQQATRAKELPVLRLDGLLPARDFLFDRPLAAGEFASEAQRQKSRRPRWHSLLQRATLQELASACPGAAEYMGFRKACVGYFLAE